MTEIGNLEPDEILFYNRMFECSPEERRNARERLEEWGEADHLSFSDRRILQRCLKILEVVERADKK